MNAKQHIVALTIMGKEYRIVCEEDEQDDLLISAQQLDIQMRKMRDSGKINGPDRIAVMAALNLAHELQILKNQNLALKRSLGECLTSISDKIETILEKA